MAWTIVAHSIQGSAGSSSGFTSTGVDTTGVDLIILALSGGNNGIAISSTDSKGNTVTQVVSAAAFGATTAIYYTKNPTVGSGHTWTVTASGTGTSLAIFGLSGSDTSQNFDQSNGASGGFTSPGSPGSITPSLDGEIVVTAAGSGGLGSTFSISGGGGYTIEDQIAGVAGNMSTGLALAYQIQTTKTATNPSWTDSANGLSGLVIASFEAAAAAGLPPGLGPVVGMTVADRSAQAAMGR
jgi:hypothetical protein